MVQVILTGEPSARPLTLRLRFQKVGPLRYISHLDLTRVFTRALIRSGIPVWYTQGYNPIPKLDFATPLSLGTESVCEYLDVRITCPVDTDSVQECLSSVLPRELAVDQVYYPETKFTEIAYSSYTVEIVSPLIRENAGAECRRLLDAEQIVVMRKSKKGDHEEDIKPLVKAASVIGETGKLTVELCMACGKLVSIKPEYLVDYLVSNLGVFDGHIDRQYYEIRRTAVYTEEMREFK